MRVMYLVEFIVLAFIISASAATPAAAFSDAQLRQVDQPVESKAQYQRLALEASVEYLVDPRLLMAVIKNESDWQPHARSPKGALGLMQLMPKTARLWGVTNPFDPRQNIFGGTRYLKHLINLFDKNIPLAIAAYHAGEERILRDGEIPDIKETQLYVRAVLDTYGRLTGFR